MKITDEQIEHWFTYHPPTPQQLTAYTQIRAVGKAMAYIIAQHCPPSADTTAAIRKVREACMTANAAVACEGR